MHLKLPRHGYGNKCLCKKTKTMAKALYFINTGASEVAFWSFDVVPFILSGRIRGGGGDFVAVLVVTILVVTSGVS